MVMVVRPATLADVPSLEIVRRQAIEATYSSYYPREDFADLVSSPDSDLSSWIESEHHRVVVVETPVTPVAYAAVDRRNGELLAVYTAPDYEGRGYATRLIEDIVQTMASTDIDSLFVWAPDPVQAFFLENGFELREERTESPFPSQRMRREFPEGH